jgi:hypothetical protein
VRKVKVKVEESEVEVKVTKERVRGTRRKLNNKENIAATNASSTTSPDFTEVNWLADHDLLPAKVPNARIMTFNYESKWHMDAPKQTRFQCAEQLLTVLENKRKEVLCELSSLH